MEYLSPYLAHYGTKGMHWGQRLYQNMDRTWTTLGKIRYGKQKVFDTLMQETEDYKRKHDAGKNEVHKVIEAGTEFSRIQLSPNYNGKHAKYVTYTPDDNDKYIGLYTTALKVYDLKTKHYKNPVDYLKRASTIPMYQVKLKTERDINFATEEQAADVTMNLLKRRKFKKNLYDSIDDMSVTSRRPQQLSILEDAKTALSTKKPKDYTDEDKKNIYRAFNLTLVNHEKNNVYTQKKFYKAMEKKGYGAITDINDKYLSSIHSQDPLIIFGKGSKNVEASSRKISTAESAAKSALYIPRMVTNELTKTLPQTLGNLEYVTMSQVNAFLAQNKDMIDRLDRTYDMAEDKRQLAEQLLSIYGGMNA